MRLLLTLALTGALATPAWAAPEAAPAAVETRFHLEPELFRSHIETASGLTLDGGGADAFRLGAEALLGRHWLAAGELAHQHGLFHVGAADGHGRADLAPDVWEAEAMLGYRFELGHLRLEPGLGYRWWHWASHVAGSGHAQPLVEGDETEQALGPALHASYELPAHWELEGQLRHYAGLPHAGQAANSGDMLEVVIGHPLAGGLIPSLGYRLEVWRGSAYSERNQFVYGRLSFVPGAGTPAASRLFGLADRPSKMAHE